MAFAKASGTVVWKWQSEWGQSSTVFFGVRVPEHFEKSFDAMPIRLRYEFTVKLIPVILVAAYAVLAYLLPSVRVPANRTILYSVAMIQAVAVRAAFWRARNQTLPFAAAAETTRSASLAELRTPNRTWRILYWLAVLAPLVLVGCAIAFIWTHWLFLRLPVDSNLQFPLTVDSPNVVWKRSDLLSSLRWAIDAVLSSDLGSLSVVAFAFNFRSRISEWGEAGGETAKLSQAVDGLRRFRAVGNHNWNDVHLLQHRSPGLYRRKCPHDSVHGAHAPLSNPLRIRHRPLATDPPLRQSSARIRQQGRRQALEVRPLLLQYSEIHVGNRSVLASVSADRP